MTTTTQMAANAQTLSGQSEVTWPSLPVEYLKPTLLYLPSDKQTGISVAFERGEAHAPLIICMNGIMMPAIAWRTCLAIFCKACTEDQRALPAPGIVVWDRYGQGASQKQAKTHDAIDVGKMLQDVLIELFKDDPAELQRRPVILLGNSIGGATSRIFADQVARNGLTTIRGVIFLDSMIANTEFVSLFAEHEDDEMSAEERKGLAVGRAVMTKIFHPSVSNGEGFDRSQLPLQLPLSNAPPLTSNPLITVMGHDNDFFARDTEERLGIPYALVQSRMNVVWQQYNEGLMQLTQPSTRARGVIRPTGASHFIQHARPDAVAEELMIMYKQIVHEQADPTNA